MKEKRSEPRLEVSLDARWQGSTANFNVRIADISVRGCYVDCVGEVFVGEPLTLTIRMPNGKWLELQGVVTHRLQRLGFGVRFVNISEKERSQIRRMMNEEHLTE